ncbi:MAG TPA: DUF4922 domain-containing protein [Syntrophorhabdaceae bacterium]|nr:DUF4922 domain-containing protein [Syntrophorhabdaceae bacterium]
MEAHLEDRIFARFDGMDLNGLCINLLSQQLLTWPILRKGYDLLKGIKIRTISCNGFTVRLQHNQGRVTSTLADTRPETIEKRPCFLCLNNLFEKQKGILYKDFLILCNPAPVFPHHLTINSIEHTPQRIESHIRFFLELSKDLGDNWIILYNGPKCGASAPDHLHFQAIPKGNTPIEREFNNNKKPLKFSDIPYVSIYYGDNLGRVCLIIEGNDIEAIDDAFNRLIDALKSHLKTIDEPMLNIACFTEKGRVSLIVFPRSKHRPDAYFKEGEDKITISPAAIEMLGVIVTPIERDFLRLKGEDIESIYHEVTIDKKTMEIVVSNMS